jgi:hypothetical protein
MSVDGKLDRDASKIGDGTSDGWGSTMRWWWVRMGSEYNEMKNVIRVYEGVVGLVNDVKD